MEDERMLGLPAVEGEMSSALWNKPSTSTKKFQRSMTTDMEQEMYDAARNLAHDPRLPFQGNVAAMGRHFFAWGIESLRLFLDTETDMLWRRLLAAQRRATSEWYVLKIDELLDQQVEFLQQWTAAEEWGAVYEDIRLAAADIAAYERVEFKRRAARGWLQHRGIKALLAKWEATMAEEEPETWRKIMEIFDWFQTVSRV